MSNWNLRRIIIPYGFHQGRAAVRLFVSGTPNECAIIASVENISPTLPIVIMPDEIEQITETLMASLRKTHHVYVYQSANRDVSPDCEWLGVMAHDEAFYNRALTNGSEIISDIHAPHLMVKLLDDTTFDHYYVLPFDAETSEECRDFVISDDNNGWIFTHDFVRELSAAELERSLSNG